MKFCYLLGYPVEHSMSAIMHNAAFKKLNLDYEYKLLLVKPEKLEKTVEYLRNTGVIGANVTIPHKITIIPYLDEIDPLAKEIGGVNTILNIEGKLKGYNTDGIGARAGGGRRAGGGAHEARGLRTDTATFAALVEARRNRRDDWYKVPAGYIDVCNVPIPARVL